MDYLPLFLVFITNLGIHRGCLAIGECKDGPTVVATVTQRTFVPGTKKVGFSLTCEVDIKDKSYVMSVWRLEKTAYVFIYTYLPPSTFAPGAGYTTRGLTFINSNTVVFPVYEMSDVVKEDLTCYLSLNNSGYTCTDIQEQNIFSIPTVKVETNPDLTSGVSDGTEVTMTLTGTDYSCSEVPTFTVKIGTGPARPLTLTPPATSGVFSTFTASVTFTVSSTESGKVEGTMMCGGDSSPFVVPVTVSVCVCEITMAIIIIVILVLKVAVFVSLIIVSFCCSDKYAVILGFYIADIVLGVVCVASGTVGSVVTQTSGCEGSEGDSALGLSIFAIILGFLNLVFIIFFLGFVFDKAGCHNLRYCGRFCAIPRNMDTETPDNKNMTDDKKDEKKKKDDGKQKPTTEETRPLRAATTKPTRALPKPKPTLTPSGTTEFGELRNAPRKTLPPPRVGHNDNDSASSASNITLQIDGDDYRR